MNYTPAKSCEESKESQAQTQDENTDENAQSAVDDDKNDTSSFDYEENGDRVHIDENGIHVHDKDGSNVVIKGGIAKLVNKIVGDIHVENGKTTVNGKVVDNDDDDKHTESNTVRIENGHVVFENKKEKRNAVVGSIVNGVTFLLCTVAYLLIGFLCTLWHPGWLLFLSRSLSAGYSTRLSSAIRPHSLSCLSSREYICFSVAAGDCGILTGQFLQLSPHTTQL